MKKIPLESRQQRGVCPADGGQATDVMCVVRPQVYENTRSIARAYRRTWKQCQDKNEGE